MKKNILLYAFLIFPAYVSFSQAKSDSTAVIRLGEVFVSANRIPLRLSKNTGAISVVTSEILSSMPKSTGVEKALRLVPGVKIDNQNNGVRVHL